MSAHETFNFHTLEEVRGRIAELGLDLPLAEDLSPLLEPVEAGPFRLANRLVVHPMEGCDGQRDGAPDELTFRRYRRFAAGGAGLLWFEATAVTEEARANPRQIWIREETLPAFARLLEETHRVARETYGPGHRPVTVLQLTHSGRYSKPFRNPAPILAHHSKFLDPAMNIPPEYPLITDEELERLEDVYVEAARCAQRAGFDAVDVKACHRYLISELHASFTRENSRYGGSFENRTRFFRNIVGKIRDRVPGLVVTSRMNVYDAMAYPYGFGVDREDPGKPDLSEPIELVRFLVATGAPVVNITVGNPYFNPYVNRPFDLPVAGGALPPEPPLAGVARFVHIVRGIQAAVPQVAVIGGGYSWLRQFFPHAAAGAVRAGWVSLVGVGRMAFAYPDFARDIQEKGGLDPLRVCVTCSACTQIMRDGGRTGCVPRDSAIYEPIYKEGRAEAVDSIREMAKTCLQCNDPTCVGGCPARVNIPQFVGHIAAGRFQAAYETLREANVLAAVCGYVCPAETLCEAGCINQHYTKAVPIRHLQRWVSRKAVEEGWSARAKPAAGATGKRVAVLGAGAAGVSAAAALASYGHAVTLFEQGAAPGGVARETIPLARLPENIIHQEIEDVLAASGAVARRHGARLGPAFTLDQVLEEGYDAVLVALGLSESVPLPGARRPVSGVVGALEFLREVKGGRKVSGAVLVLGGGNTAIDAALSAKRAGAADVSIVYRRSFAEMPAWPEERDQAIRAGVNFLILTQPLDYVTDEEGRLTGLKVIRTRLGAPGEDGRRRPEPLAGSEHLLPADLAVEAIGQRVGDELMAALTGVRLTRAGLVWTRKGTLETSREGVFAAGDIINGGATVVQAVAEGARAAREIDSYLKGA
jgi:NADPH-dependent glutamate synthase beta subunit-like oxidoreductase/2,4-dienoyl-CoA reductase-like NADH-dependent reductase (Old Yellow Enzyme family)